MQSSWRPQQGLLAAGILVVLVGCSWQPAGTHDSPVEDERTSRATPPRPAGGIEVQAGQSLQQIIDSAPEGAVLCLSPGSYQGPLRLAKPLTLWGPPEAIISSHKGGRTISIVADHVRVLGVSIDGSGDRPDQKDAGVFIHANDVVVQGVRVVRALFGIVAERCQRISIDGNEVIGDPAAPIGLRGDGIQFWETRDSLIRGNRLSHSRDILLQYSPSNQVVENVCEHGRYGTHFMYSSDGVVRRNRFLSNTVGVFVMYSRSIIVEGNTLAGSTEFGGMGIGIKESGNISIRDNQLINNHAGLYLDNSPFDRRDSITASDNRMALCDTGVTFLSSAERCTFQRNDFEANRQQVRVEGHGDAMKVTWKENWFDDYQGYDLDGDGWGDVPHELRSYSAQMTAKYPSLLFFRGSSPLAVIEATGRLLPLLTPQPILIDGRPRMSRRRIGT